MSGATAAPEIVPAGVRLRVRDGEAARRFWGDVVGLRVEEEGGGREMRCVPPGGRDPVVVLEIDPSAGPPGRAAAGLFHLALLVPDRPALARVYRRLVAAGVSLQGAADHLVSEALYLADPEGNGLEIYADRPREAWSWHRGEIRMATEPLDLAGLLAAGAGEAGVPEGTTLGHVHLRTRDLDAAEAFWTEEVGLEVTTRSWPGARFLASGGYHHHLGLNSWGPRVGPRPPGVTGLVATVWRGTDRGRELEDPDGQRVVVLPLEGC